MSPLLAAVVEWDKLLDVVIYASAAGIGVTAVFGIGVLGATRMVDMSREGRAVEAGFFGVVAVAALAAVVAAVVLGIIVMTTK